MYTPHLLLSFLRKFFFILKAASDGWIVRYIGANKFQFRYSHYSHSKAVCKDNTESTEMFVKNYVCKSLV